MQSLVLGFFLVAWISLVAILVVEPGIYDSAMKLPAGRHVLADLAFLGAISAFIALLVVGVLRRWRWTFWLILVAFLFGVLRVPASVLELPGCYLRPDRHGTCCFRPCSALPRSRSGF